jgi:hypothetical protein
MGQDIHLLDVVALIKDIPEEKLWKGQVGTVVEEFKDDNVEVEFADQEGVAYAFLDIKKSDLLKLHHEQATELVAV